MEYKEFKKILKEYGLTLKKFSELSEVSYGTCVKWGKDDRPVPNWVNSWFRLFDENKNLKENNTTAPNEEYQELLQLKESLHAVMSGLNK